MIHWMCSNILLNTCSHINYVSSKIPTITHITYIYINNILIFYDVLFHPKGLIPWHMTVIYVYIRIISTFISLCIKSQRPLHKYILFHYFCVCECVLKIIVYIISCAYGMVCVCLCCFCVISRMSYMIFFAKTFYKNYLNNNAHIIQYTWICKWKSNHNDIFNSICTYDEQLISLCII